MLNMGPHSQLGSGKAEARYMIAGCAQSAEVVLLWSDITAIGKETRFLECLTECDIRADSLPAGFLIIVAYDILNGAGQPGLWISFLDEADHLFLGRFSRASNRDTVWSGIYGHHGGIIGWRNFPMDFLDDFFVDVPGHC